MFRDWEAAYLKDKKYRDIFKALKGGNFSGRETYALMEDKMFHDGKICVPKELVDSVLSYWHQHETPHSSGPVMATDLQHRMEIDDMDKRCKALASSCSQCQAAQPPNFRRTGKLLPHPVPDRVMDKVAMDLFHFTPCTVDGIKYDTALLITDLKSGYIVCVPTTEAGLTAEKTGKLTVQHWLSVFDIPSGIICDRGPQFAGSWYRGLCAGLGIHNHYVTVGRHQGNPAEGAGRQVKAMLRKALASTTKYTWVDLLPVLLRRYHNTPNLTGLSPNEILFGRKRLGPGPALPQFRKLPSVDTWFKIQSEMEELISKTLKTARSKQAEQYNK